VVSKGIGLVHTKFSEVTSVGSNVERRNAQRHRIVCYSYKHNFFS
jgi:hypothetical protein